MKFVINTLSLTGEWISLAVVGSLKGLLYGGLSIALFVTLLVVGKHPASGPDPVWDAYAMDLAKPMLFCLPLAMLAGAVHGTRFAIRKKTRARLMGILAASGFEDNEIQKRAGRCWFRWCCGRPMLKFAAGKAHNLHRTCMHCGRHEHHTIVEFHMDDPNDVWGWLPGAERTFSRLC